MTALGASSVSAEVIAAATSILPRFVLMTELQAAASRAIAEATGAEAGCITASVASGISVAVAACMTGVELSRIEQLPDTRGLRNEVLLQKGHDVNFGASISQMIGLTGAQVVEVGTATSCGAYQLRGAMTEQTAAAVYVVSHHTVQSGLIDLQTFCTVCHEAGVPVVVDAASEYDLRGFLSQGADVVLYSAHKFLGGLTAGIIAGGLDLVRACYLQERGIGRAMKVGKEGIVGAIAALERWKTLDHDAIHQHEARRVESAVQRLRGLDGLEVDLEPDPTGNPITRVKVTVVPEQAGVTAYQLARRLAEGNPAIVVRDHHVDRGYLLLDPCNLSDEEMDQVCAKIAEALRNTAGPVQPDQIPSMADVWARGITQWPGAALGSRPGAKKGGV
jgi:L-seryl-tRNA(Ser) seleniumtransferase